MGVLDLEMDGGHGESRNVEGLNVEGRRRKNVERLPHSLITGEAENRQPGGRNTGGADCRLQTRQAVPDGGKVFGEAVIEGGGMASFSTASPIIHLLAAHALDSFLACHLAVIFVPPSCQRTPERRATEKP